MNLCDLSKKVPVRYKPGQYFSLLVLRKLFPLASCLEKKNGNFNGARYSLQQRFHDPAVHVVVRYRSRLVGLTHATIGIEYQQEKCDYSRHRC